MKIDDPSDVPTKSNRFLSRDGKFYNGYIASPDYAEDLGSYDTVLKDHCSVTPHAREESFYAGWMAHSRYANGLHEKATRGLARRVLELEEHILENVDTDFVQKINDRKQGCVREE